MSDEPWTAEVQRIYESVAGHDLTPEDEARLEAAGFSEEQLKEAFQEGWLETNSPYSTTTTMSHSDIPWEDREQVRMAFFEWMEYLGYDGRFDWQAWRDWSGAGDS